MHDFLLAKALASGLIRAEISELDRSEEPRDSIDDQTKIGWYLRNKQDEYATDTHAHNRDSQAEYLSLEKRREEQLIEDEAFTVTCVLSHVLPAIEVEGECHQSEDQERPDGYKKAHEYSVVVYADTVVDPGAVMVEAFHTFLADAAMA